MQLHIHVTQYVRTVAYSRLVLSLLLSYAVERHNKQLCSANCALLSLTVHMLVLAEVAKDNTAP